MKKVIGYVGISILASLLITGTTFLVGESVVAPIPGEPGAAGTAIVSGFPIPYATLFPCCGSVGGRGGSIFLNNSYFYHPQNFVADFTIWLAISLGVLFTFSLSVLVLAAVAGLGVTLLTLLLAPLSIVRPTPAMETSVLRPMGFPYDYLTYYVTGLGAVTNSGYEFTLSPALADYALWTGIVATLIGVTVIIVRVVRAKSANSSLQPLFYSGG